MRDQVRSYVVLALCTALLLSVLMSCGKSPVTPVPTPTTGPTSLPATPIPVATPEPTLSPLPMPALTPAAGAVDPAALLPYLPDGSQVAGTVRAELDGDGESEVMVLLGIGGTAEGLGYDHMEMMVLEPDKAPGQVIAWHSTPLMGERGEALQVRDINNDGRDEVLSYQSMGAAGYTLYVVSWKDGAIGLMRPKGGYFAGQGHFGDVGVHLEDIDRDGVQEILASYGPAGSSTDVYRWDGTEYVFGITLLDK